MVKKPQIPTTCHDFEDPTPEVEIPSREQQWLDVVSHPAPLLPPKIEATPTVPGPKPLFVGPEVTPSETTLELDEAYSTPLRCLAIILLTAIFLLAWQQRVGDESTVDRISSSSLLNKSSQP